MNLPSRGKFWPEGSLDLPVTGKIPVYPMTTKDEITLKTPDALIDGTSVVTVLQSCCPNIKNAWEMPSVDTDALLIAIRIASYGSNMPLGSNCPSCKTPNEYEVNLNQVLDNLQIPDYSEPIRINEEITIKLRPLNYKQVSKSGAAAFEEQRFVQSLSDHKDSMTPEDMKEQYNTHLERLLDMTVDNLVACTESVTVNSVDIVTNPEFIKEYYINADGSAIKMIQDKIKEYVTIMAIKPMQVTCPECDTTYDLNVDFDYSSFFAAGF
jgi:hypothetical protein